MEPSSAPTPPAPDSSTSPAVRVQSLSSTVGGSGPTEPAHELASPIPQGPHRAATPAPAPVPVVHLQQAPGPVSTSAPVTGKQNPIMAYWRKVGGGSLALSLLIHAGILVIAYFMVQKIVQEPKVDFLPGGSSKAGRDASASLSATLDRKNKSKVKPKSPIKRVVSTANTAVVLPDLPMDTLDMPETSSLLGGGMNSGGFGNMGAGGGSGSGIGMGSTKGFTGMTFFGRAGVSDGIPGAFYDMKQDRDRKPLVYSGSFPEYAANINKAASKRFSPTSLKDYYKANQEVSFTYLLVPANLPAAEGPKCFNAEKEVEPRGWFVHYTGMVTPPKSGTWRFVGFFDDLLIVYINNKPVLDGSWVPMAGEGKDRDEEIRQEFKGPSISGNRTAYAGKWIKMSEPFKLDIVVGETPGGLVGGLLMVQNKDEKYEARADGTPILPLFTTAKLEMTDVTRLQNDAFAKRVQLAPEPPVFGVRRSALNDENPRGIGLLPMR